MLGFWSVELKELGPLQAYVFPPPEVKLILFPTQTGLLLPIIGTGKGLTTTLVVDELIQPLALDMVNVYMPAFDAEAGPTDGFCRLEPKLLGPVQV